MVSLHLLLSSLYIDLLSSHQVEFLTSPLSFCSTSHPVFSGSKRETDVFFTLHFSWQPSLSHLKLSFLFLQILLIFLCLRQTRSSVLWPMQGVMCEWPTGSCVVTHGWFTLHAWCEERREESRTDGRRERERDTDRIGRWGSVGKERTVQYWEVWRHYCAREERNQHFWKDWRGKIPQLKTGYKTETQRHGWQ